MHNFMAVWIIAKNRKCFEMEYEDSEGTRKFKHSDIIIFYTYTESDHLIPLNLASLPQN